MTRVPLIAAACLVLVAAPVAYAVSGSAKATKSAKLVTTINVIAGKPTEFAFKLSSKTAKRGIIRFKIVNSGLIGHDFKFCTKRVTSAAANSCTGRGTQPIGPGASQTLTVTVLLAGTYEYLCTLPAHAASGMKGLIKVT
jgi:uncharacterized cupredoxin-like copper-binding protein